MVSPGHAYRATSVSGRARYVNCNVLYTKMPFRNINLRDSGECSVSKVLAAHDESSDPQHSCLKRHSCDPSAGEAGTGRSLGLTGQTTQWDW